MKHAREDYNRIQDPENKIGKDEPVFLLRAQDKFAPVVVRFWAELVEAAGNEYMAAKAFEHACDMDDWQQVNGSKTPDVP